MTVRFVQRGDAIDYTPATAVSAGDVVVQGDLVGVAKLDIAANTLGALAVSGVFDIPKATGAGTALAAGTFVFYDETNAIVTDDDAGDHKLAGITVAAASDDDTTARVLLIQGERDLETADPSGTVSDSFDGTETGEATPSGTDSESDSETETGESTDTSDATPSGTDTATVTDTVEGSASASQTETDTAEVTPSATDSDTAEATETDTDTAEATPSGTETSGVQTAYLDPDGDGATTDWSTTDWSTTGPPGSHYEEVNDGTREPNAPDTNDYVYCVGGGDNRNEEFTMTTVAGVTECSEVTIRAHGYEDENCDVTCQVYLGGEWKTAVDFAFDDGSYNWKSATFSGTWDQDDIDALQVRLLRVVSGPSDECRVATFYAEITYT